MPEVTRAEFARMLGVNRSTVTRWVKDGRITLTASGRIDPDAARRQLGATESVEPHHIARREQIAAQRGAGAARQRETAGGQGDGAPEGAQGAPGREASASEPLPSLEHLGAALKAETLKLQRAKAEKAALEVDQIAGALVEREEVEYVLRAIGVTCRSVLEALPDRLTASVISCGGEAAAVHQVLEEALREALSEVDHAVVRLTEGGDDG